MGPTAKGVALLKAVKLLEVRCFPSPVIARGFYAKNCWCWSIFNRADLASRVLDDRQALRGALEPTF